MKKLFLAVAIFCLAVAFGYCQDNPKPEYKVSYVSAGKLTTLAVQELKKAGLDKKYDAGKPFYIQTPSQMGEDYVGFTVENAKQDADGNIPVYCLVEVNSIFGRIGTIKELPDNSGLVCFVHLDSKTGIVSGYKWQPQTSPQSFQTSPLQLTIKSDKQVYEAGEEINISVELVNVGEIEINYGLPPLFEDPELVRVFFQNGENVVVKSKTRGTIEGSGIQRVPIEGAKQRQVVIGSGKKYAQSFIISRYFDFIPDVYEIYLENKMTEEKLKISGVNWTGTLTSNTITIEVKEKQANKQVERAVPVELKFSFVSAAPKPNIPTDSRKITEDAVVNIGEVFVVPITARIGSESGPFYKIHLEGDSVKQVYPLPSDAAISLDDLEAIFEPVKEGQSIISIFKEGYFLDQKFTLDKKIRIEVVNSPTPK